MNERKILCLYEDTQKSAASIFESLPIDCTVKLFSRSTNWNKEDYTDLITVGFSYSPEFIEELYMYGYKNILSIDLYYDDHPLSKLNIMKNPMPFLDYKGKWAILLADDSWYNTCIKELVNG